MVIHCIPLLDGKYGWVNRLLAVMLFLVFCAASPMLLLVVPFGFLWGYGIMILLEESDILKGIIGFIYLLFASLLLVPLMIYIVICELIAASCFGAFGFCFVVFQYFLSRWEAQQRVNQLIKDQGARGKVRRLEF